MLNNKKLENILCSVIVLTNLSQLPFFVDKGVTGYVSYACWGFLAIMLLLINNKISRNAMNIILGICFLFIVLSLFYMVTGRDYLGSNVFSSIIVSSGVLIISSFIPKESFGENGVDLDRLYYSYVISATIVALVVYFEYFGVGFTFTSRLYNYGAKNSTSQIIITAVVLSLFTIQRKKSIKNILNYGCIVINIVLLMVMRSRASIIGLVVVVVMALATSKINRRLRFMLGLAVVGCILLVVFNEKTYDLIVNDILLGSRDSTDLNDISSGRVEQWERFPELFAEHPFIGRGAYYIESFPLVALLNFGFIIGSAIICYAMYPAAFAFRNRHVSKHHYILLVLSLIYLLNGVFEELSPFGPGVKCYFIWFMLGILMSNKNIMEKEREFGNVRR